jgi:hypothetical protein
VFLRRWAAWPGVSRASFRKQSLAHGGVELIALEAEIQVGAAGTVVAFEHLEGQLAAAPLASHRLYMREKGPGDALAAEILVHHDVVHVEQRPAGEGREALHAVDQPDRALPGVGYPVGDVAEHLGPPAQLCRQALAQFVAHRLAVARRALHVVVEEGEEVVAAAGVVEVGGSDGEGLRFSRLPWGVHGRVAHLPDTAYRRPTVSAVSVRMMLPATSRMGV